MILSYSKWSLPNRLGQQATKCRFHSENRDKKKKSKKSMEESAGIRGKRRWSLGGTIALEGPKELGKLSSSFSDFLHLYFLLNFHC